MDRTQATATTRITPLDEATFDAAARGAAGAVAVEFGAEWCAPCHVLQPELEAAAEALAGRVRFHAVDADADPGLVVRYGVRGLPTVLLFRDGELADRIVGAQSRDRLIARIEGALADATTRQTT